MGILSNMFASSREKKRKLKDYEENDRIVNSVNERKKSHYERELIKRLEEEKEENIKKALKWDDEYRKLNDRKKARELMTFHPNMFNNDSILGWE